MVEFGDAFGFPFDDFLAGLSAAGGFMFEGIDEGAVEVDNDGGTPNYLGLLRRFIHLVGLYASYARIFYGVGFESGICMTWVSISGI